jgi:hypothetical protein
MATSKFLKSIQNLREVNATLGFILSNVEGEWSIAIAGNIIRVQRNSSNMVCLGSRSVKYYLE